MNLPMKLQIICGRAKRNRFNEALDAHYLRLYDYMVKDHRGRKPMPDTSRSSLFDGQERVFIRTIAQSGYCISQHTPVMAHWLGREIIQYDRSDAPPPLPHYP